MSVCKKTLLLCAAKLLTLISAVLILSACSTFNARIPEQPVCKVTQPEAALMQARPNGQLTIGLNRLEAALAAQTKAMTIAPLQIIESWQANARRLAELGDESNANVISLQDFVMRAVARCAAP